MIVKIKLFFDWSKDLVLDLAIHVNSIMTYDQLIRILFRYNWIIKKEGLWIT